MTAREKEILRAYAGGADIGDIAEKLRMKRDLLAATISALCSYNRATARELLRNGGKPTTPSATTRPAPLWAPAAPGRQQPPEPPQPPAQPEHDPVPAPIIARYRAQRCPSCGWIGACLPDHVPEDDCGDLEPVTITITPDVTRMPGQSGNGPADGIVIGGVHPLAVGP